jgi:hypothetical protein
LPDVLYHFTCAHGRRGIGTSNCLLLPHFHPLLGCKLLWLTNQASPDRERTGLTMRYQPCDRMQFRYVVSDLSGCHPWLDSPQRDNAPRHIVEDVESYGAPHEWWIADRPVRARFDRGWT